MIIETILLILITILFINKIIIILDEEKLEDEIKIAKKIIQGKQLTREEENYVRKHRR